ncbi:MAG TPA: triose-phosphate isomerase [Candidatus Paceibacterota bacterium]
MSKKIIVANWKMNPQTLAEAQDILSFMESNVKPELAQKSVVVICPPFVFIEEVSKILSTGRLADLCALGAQDIASKDEHALTGEVSGEMLEKLVRYVIIGHSERRWKIGESDAEVNRKLKIALEHNLIPIICLGEKDIHNREEFLIQQTENTFKDLDPQSMARCVIAYEPVWAISTTPDSQPDSPESAREAIEVIKKTLSQYHPQLVDIRFLYGGSVNSANAQSFLNEPSIHGLMVGSASVDKEEFVKILLLF